MNLWIISSEAIATYAHKHAIYLLGMSTFGDCMHALVIKIWLKYLMRLTKSQASSWGSLSISSCMCDARSNGAEQPDAIPCNIGPP